MSNSNIPNGAPRVRNNSTGKDDSVLIDVVRNSTTEITGSGRDEVDSGRNSVNEELINALGNIELTNSNDVLNNKDDGTNEDEIIAQKVANTYAAKKTVAQGMMDIALITANANQLRYIVEFTRHSPTFYLVVSLVVISLILQIAVGLCLIFKGRMDLKGKSKDPKAKAINNYVVVGVFLVTIINVFIASFTTTGGGPVANQNQKS